MPMKRPSSNPELAQASKRRKSQCAQVAKTSEGVLTVALGALKEERTVRQQTVVGCLDQIFSGLAAEMRESIVQLSANLGNVQSQQAALLASKATAATHLASLKEAVEQSKEKQAADIRGLKAAGKAVSESEHAQEAGDEELEQAATRRMELEAAKAASRGAIPGKRAQNKVIAVLDEIDSYDQSLPKFLHGAFEKEPAVRGTFDKMVVQMFGDLLSGKVIQFEQLLAERANAQAGRAAAVEAAKARLEAAQAEKQASAEAASAARAAVVEGDAALDAATKQAKDFEPVLKASTKSLEAATRQLAAFEAGPQAVFAELRDRAAPPPALAEPAPPLEAAEGGAEAAAGDDQAP